MADDNVKVAVRVRPFNDREKKMDARNCISMDAATQQTVIHNFEDGRQAVYQHAVMALWRPPML